MIYRAMTRPLTQKLAKKTLPIHQNLRKFELSTFIDCASLKFRYDVT